MPESTPAARAPQQRPPSVWEDLLEIFYAPATVFARRRDTPAFGLALIVFGVLVLGLSFAFRGMMEPVLDAEWKRGMAQALKANPQLTPEMMEKGKGVARTFFYVAIGFYAFVTPILLGLLLWVVGKFLGSKAEVGQMLMVGTYGMFREYWRASSARRRRCSCRRRRSIHATRCSSARRGSWTRTRATRCCWHSRDGRICSPCGSQCCSGSGWRCWGRCHGGMRWSGRS